MLLAFLVFQSEEPGLGVLEERVVGVKESYYTLMGELGLWSLTSPRQDSSSENYYVERVRVALDMNFTTWLYAYLEAEHTGPFAPGPLFSQAYVELDPTPTLSVFVGRRKLFWGLGQVLGEMLQGSPGLSVEMGEAWWLKGAGVLVRDTLAMVASAGGSLGPLYPYLTAGFCGDVWLGGGLEVLLSPFLTVKMEGASYKGEDADGLGISGLAVFELGPWLLTGATVIRDSGWRPVSGQGPDLTTPGSPWRLPGYLFSMDRRDGWPGPFWSNYPSRMAATSAGIGFRYTPPFREDLTLTPKLEFLLAQGQDSTLAKELDLCLGFEVSRELGGGLVGAYEMEKGDWGLGLWVAKDFQFGD